MTSAAGAPASRQEWMRAIPGTAITTSAVIAGGSPIGGMPRLYGHDVDEDDAIDVAAQVLRSPIRAWDTSNNYGASERRIGSAIAAVGGLPDDFTVMTKVDGRDGAFSGDRVRDSLAESEERLGLDRLPLVFLHDPEWYGFDAITRRGGAVDTLVRLKEEGRVGSIGVASGDVHEVDRYLDLGVFDVLLSHNRWTLVDRSAGDLFDKASAAGMGILNAAVYGGGILADPASRSYGYHAAAQPVLDAVAAMDAACRRHGTDLATAALQFSLREPRVDATVVGFSKPSRIGSIMAAVDAELPDDLWIELEAMLPSREYWLDFRSGSSAAGRLVE